MTRRRSVICSTSGAPTPRTPPATSTPFSPRRARTAPTAASRPPWRTSPAEPGSDRRPCTATSHARRPHRGRLRRRGRLAVPRRRSAGRDRRTVAGLGRLDTTLRDLHGHQAGTTRCAGPGVRGLRACRQARYDYGGTAAQPSSRIGRRQPRPEHRRRHAIRHRRHQLPVRLRPSNANESSPWPSPASPSDPRPEAEQAPSPRPHVRRRHTVPIGTQRPVIGP